MASKQPKPKNPYTKKPNVLAATPAPLPTAPVTMPSAVTTKPASSDITRAREESKKLTATTIPHIPPTTAEEPTSKRPKKSSKPAVSGALILELCDLMKSDN